MAEIEDMGPAREGLDDPPDLLVQRRAARRQQQIVEIALDHGPGLKMLRRPAEGNRDIEGHRVDPGLQDIVGMEGAGAPRESDHRDVGMRRLDGRDDPFRRIHGPAAELGFAQDARPAVEQLQGLGAGVGLPDEMDRRRLDQEIDQGPEFIRIAVGPAADLRVIPARAPFNHVGRDGPGRAGEPDQGDVRRQPGVQLGDGLVDAGQVAVKIVEPKTRQGIGLLDRLQPRPRPGLEPNPLAQRVRHHQDVAEQDGGIEIITPERLQRGLHRHRRGVAEIEETLRLAAELPIFRQVPPRLAHHPDGRGFRSNAAENLKEFLFCHADRTVGERAQAGFFNTSL